MIVPFQHVDDRSNALDWSSGDQVSNRNVALLPEHRAMQCLLIFDMEENPRAAYRNRLLSTNEWFWYGNVVLVPVDGDWPPNYIPHLLMIHSTLWYYSS